MTPRHFFVRPAPRRRRAPSRDMPPAFPRVFWAHAFLDS
jgi:hypothetical protein